MAQNSFFHFYVLLSREGHDYTLRFAEFCSVSVFLDRHLASIGVFMGSWPGYWPLHLD